MAAILLGVRGLVATAPPTAQPDPLAPAGLLLIFGTIGSCIAAGTACFAALSPLPIYRRGGLSMVTAFAVFVAGLLLAPVNAWFGLPGLGAVALLTAVGGWALWRRVLRLRGAR
jgi:hypothetical protein